jgi:hypothetical protein
MEQPSAPAEILKAIEMYKDFFMLVMGTWDFDRAQGAGGGKDLAYKTLQALIEIASMMAQGKIRNYSRMDREWGRMFVSHVQNWYIDKDRIYTTIKTADGKETSVAVYGPDLILPIKLSVVSGSTMPVSRIQEREQAISLTEKGLADQKYLLDKLDVSGGDEIIKRMQEGPLADLISKLTELGFPPPIIQLMQMLQKIDPKNFERAIKDGKMPTFEQLLTGQQPTKPGEGAAAQPTVNPQVEQAQVAGEKAKAAKAIAEAQLISEKINTEKIEQQVKAAGMEFDNQKLEIERARLVNDIQAKRNELASMGDKQHKKTQGPYDERGGTSNNQTEQ